MCVCVCLTRDVAVVQGEMYDGTQVLRTYSVFILCVNDSQRRSQEGIYCTMEPGAALRDPVRLRPQCK